MLRADSALLRATSLGFLDFFALFKYVLLINRTTLLQPEAVVLGPTDWDLVLNISMRNLFFENQAFITIVVYHLV